MSSSTEKSKVEGNENVSYRLKNIKGLQSRDDLKLMVERMDNRRAPTLEKFNEESRLFLRENLVEFEDFCMENIKGDCKNWIKELGINLTGDFLDTLKQFKMYRYSYPHLKIKLLQWYEDMKEVRREQHKRIFEKISPKKEESLFLYNTRNERTFRLTFPKEKHVKSANLRQKYLETNFILQ